MTREELLAMIYEDNTVRSCPTEEVRCGLEDAEINTQEYCRNCAETLLTEYENKIKADERAKVIDDFTIKLENAIQEDVDDNVISQWDKGTFMGCVRFVAEQLKEREQ